MAPSDTSGPKAFEANSIGYRKAGVKTVAGASRLRQQSGGAGLAMTKWNGVRGTGSPTFTARSSKFQWQGIAGVTVPLREQLDLYVDCRYANSLNNKFDSVPTGACVTQHDDASHNVFLGLRYTFGKKEEPWP